MDVFEKLERSFYVRSKISYYPLSHQIVPVPEGLSAVVFETKEDIEQFFQMRGVTDPENFEILPISSFYDFMRDAAGMGFIGIWFFKNFPVLFGNYLSEIDIDLPSFCYTYDNDFIGASGLIEQPAEFIPWRNYFRTDKIIRRFVRYVNGVPFLPDDELYTIVRTDIGDIQNRGIGEKGESDKYCIFNSASPLQGPYVSDIGAYALFTEKETAERYIEGGSDEQKARFAVEHVKDLNSFLDSVSENFPFVHIGVNPNSERYLQGYFLNVDDKWYLKTVLGLYALTNDLTFEEITEDIPYSDYRDTINHANSIDVTLRGINSTIKNPLKHHKGKTNSTIPRRESLYLLEKLVNSSCYKKGVEQSSDSVQPSNITSDSYLVFAFDKVSGQQFTNNEELISPYVFSDVIDAIFYFYHIFLTFEYKLRLEGFYYCTNKQYTGSNDEKFEQYMLSEQRNALKELLEMILVEGYSIEHSELLKSYLNRISVSLEIEECGYLGDLAIYKKPFMDEQLQEFEDSPIQDRVFKLSNAYCNRLASKIELDEKYQNKIMVYLGNSYTNLSVESLCILESALKQFESVTQRINHDYAGISMKLCKVFERELQIMVLNRWKQHLSGIFSKSELKRIKQDAEKDRDLTTVKLIGWLLKKNKLELGPMGFIFDRISSNCDNSVLENLNGFVSSYGNADFLKSESLKEAINQISTRYRNGGVHEKIVTYETCNEAFERILTSENSHLKRLASF